MARRGLRTGPTPDPRQWRHASAMPIERLPPFLLVPQPADDPRLAGILIAPFPRRSRGLTPDEAALLQAVSGHLRNLPGQPRGPVWIDAHTGAATAAAIGEGQLRRRLIDCATFNVRGPSLGNGEP